MGERISDASWEMKLMQERIEKVNMEVNGASTTFQSGDVSHPRHCGQLSSCIANLEM